jgi:hypothetical protein
MIMKIGYDPKEGQQADDTQAPEQAPKSEDTQVSEEVKGEGDLVD